MKILKLLTVALLFFVTSTTFAIELEHSTTQLSTTRYNIAATSVGSLAMFAGGYHYSDVVDIYDHETGEWSTASLSIARNDLSATSIGDLALFAGGEGQYVGHSTVVDIYNANTNLWSTAQLSLGRRGMGATTAGNKAIFAGGWTGNGISCRVVDIFDYETQSWSTDMLPEEVIGGPTVAGSIGDLAFFHSNNNDIVAIYDTTSETWSTAHLSQWRDAMAVASVGNKILFAGGCEYALSNVVDIFDRDTGLWSTATLSQPRSQLAAAVSGDYAFFAGGIYTLYPTHYRSDVVDIYNSKTGEWSTTTLSEARAILVGTGVGDQVLFAAGQNASGTTNTVDIFTVVPEPYSVTLILMGCLSFGIFAYTKRGRA